MPWRFKGSFLAGYLTGLFSTILILIVALAAAAYFLRADMVARKAERLKPPPIAALGPADYTWSVIDPQGAPHTMEEFKGRPLFLQFWSPSCTACEAEIPAINAMQAALEGKGVHIVAVATDTTPDELNEVAARLNITYPIYALGGPLPELYKFTAGPVTYLITHDGNIAYKHTGAAKWDDPQLLTQLTLMAAAADQTP